MKLNLHPFSLHYHTFSRIPSLVGQGDLLGFLRPEALLDQLADHFLCLLAHLLQLLV
jgi:hypothetical protein